MSPSGCKGTRRLLWSGSSEPDRNRVLLPHDEAAAAATIQPLTGHLPLAVGVAMRRPNPDVVRVTLKLLWGSIPIDFEDDMTGHPRVQRVRHELPATLEPSRIECSLAIQEALAIDGARIVLGC